MTPQGERATHDAVKIGEGLMEQVAATSGVKLLNVEKAMKGLASVMQTELKQKGEGMIPGVCRLKVEKKPAMKAGTRLTNGKNHSEGITGHEDREGFPGGGPDEEHLKLFCSSL